MHRALFDQLGLADGGQVRIRQGNGEAVLSAEVAQGSGHDFLDRAGLDLMRRASPLPPLPAETGQDSMVMRIPISFTYD